MGRFTVLYCLLFMEIQNYIYGLGMKDAQIMSKYWALFQKHLCRTKVFVHHRKNGTQVIVHRTDSYLFWPNWFFMHGCNFDICSAQAICVTLCQGYCLTTDSNENRLLTLSLSRSLALSLLSLTFFVFLTAESVTSHLPFLNQVFDLNQNMLFSCVIFQITGTNPPLVIDPPLSVFCPVVFLQQLNSNPNSQPRVFLVSSLW